GITSILGVVLLGRGGAWSSSVDEVGEDRSVDLADFDPHRHLPFLRDRVENVTEVAASPSHAVWRRLRLDIDCDLEGIVVGSGDDHVWKHRRYHGLLVFAVTPVHRFTP